MSIYDAFKDVIQIAMKADNLELYRQLLDLSAQALDLQAENARLKEVNESLMKRKITEDRIVRHNSPYLTLSDDELKLKYCAVCWDSDQTLIQMLEIPSDCGNKPSLHCHKCNHFFTIDS